MDNLRTHARAASTSLTALTPRALAAAAALTVLRAATDESAEALHRLRGRAAAAGASLIDARASTAGMSTSLRAVARSSASADSRMDAMTARTRVLRDDMNELNGAISRVGGSMGGLRGSLGSLGSSAGGASGGQRGLMMAALALAPALIPVAAAAAPIAPALGAAAVAVTAFGAALVPQLLAMGKITEAHKAYTQSLTENGRTSKTTAQAENEWLKQVQKASPEVRKAAASLSVMKDEYKSWSESLAGDTLPVATKGFGVLSMLFPKLTPLVRATSVEMDRLMNRLAVGVHSKGFDEFMVKLTDFTQRTLHTAVDGMVKFGQAMNRGVQSDGFREFLAYVRESGPIVGETLANLGRALMKLVAAAADTGVGILTIVNALAKLVNAVPTEVLSVLLQMAFAIKALQLVTTGLGPAFMAAAAGANNFVRAARFGGVTSAIQGVTASLTAMQRASIVLAVIAAVAMGINALAEKAKGAPPDVDRLTTSLKRLGSSGQFTGELKKAFGDMDGFARTAHRLRVATEMYDNTKRFTALIPLGGLIDKVTPKLEQLVSGTNSVAAASEKFAAFDEAFANLAKGGHADMAATQVREFEEVLRTQGYTAEQVDQTFSKYNATVAAMAADQELAARSMGLFGDQAIAVQAKLDMQKQSADGLRESIQALNDVNRQALGGMIGFEAAIDAAAKGAAENAGALNMVNGVLDLNGEKARTAASLLADLADKTDLSAAAARDNGASWESVSGIYERGREQLMASARTMGLTRDEAKALADQILKTPDKTAYLRGDVDDLKAKLADAYRRLEAAPSHKKVDIYAEIEALKAGIGRATSLLGGMKTDYEVRVHYRTIGYIPSGGHQFEKASGGIIGAAGGGPRSRMTLVGEQGPELVDLAPGSRVHSNPDSRRIAAGMGGGGGNGPIVLEIRSGGSRWDDMLVDSLRHAIRVKGGDVQVVLGTTGR
ncbi:hypothetical protein [Streptomyces sp. NPDC054849]